MLAGLSFSSANKDLGGNQNFDKGTFMDFKGFLWDVIRAWRRNL